MFYVQTPENLLLKVINYVIQNRETNSKIKTTVLY